MLYRVMAFCGLALTLVAGGLIVRSQTGVVQNSNEGVASPPVEQGASMQPVTMPPAPPQPSAPSPPSVPLAQADTREQPAAAAVPPAVKPATPPPAVVAPPPAQTPVADAPKAAASAPISTAPPPPSAPTPQQPAAVTPPPPPATPAPVVVETPLPAPKPAMPVKETGKEQTDESKSAAGSPVIEQPARLPAWLKAHVGEGDGQIALVVLQRARALYRQKVSQGIVKNPCYFAMDATRPSDLGGGKLGRRFYIVCEAHRTFHAISSGHGSGRKLKGIPDFKNGRQCAKNFGNALDSKLTTGGAYVTGKVRTSFEGYYHVSARKDEPLSRSFVPFDGEGDTANSMQRAIGGHAAVLLRGVCLRKEPGSPHADSKGYVPFGKLVDYAGGRSNGCTSWSRPDARRIVGMVKDDPTTLYIYPDAADIDAVAQAVQAHRSLSRAGLYWNAACLKEIHAPKFWPKKTLEPILAQYKKQHPPGPNRPPPICKAPVVSAKN